MINDYELGLIYKSTLPDEEIAKEKVDLEGFLKEEKGVVGKYEEWGRKRMTYSIKKEANGYYLFLGFQCEPATIKKLDHKLKLNKNILRFLITLS